MSKLQLNLCDMTHGPIDSVVVDASQVTQKLIELLQTEWSELCAGDSITIDESDEE